MSVSPQIQITSFIMVLKAPYRDPGQGPKPSSSVHCLLLLYTLQADHDDYHDDQDDDDYDDDGDDANLMGQSPQVRQRTLD